jgi:hypothetical protein
VVSVVAHPDITVTRRTTATRNAFVAFMFSETSSENLCIRCAAELARRRHHFPLMPPETTNAITSALSIATAVTRAAGTSTTWPAKW